MLLAIATLTRGRTLGNCVTDDSLCRIGLQPRQGREVRQLPCVLNSDALTSGFDGSAKGGPGIDLVGVIDPRSIPPVELVWSQQLCGIEGC